MTDKKTEALKLALEALKLNCSSQTESPATKAIAAIDEALSEQPAQQQEPVAYIRKDQLQKAAQSPMLCEVTPEPRQDRIGIHTSPQPSKPWVGLTDEERSEIGQEAIKFDWLVDYAEAIDFVIDATEAKLKEKNA